MGQNCSSCKAYGTFAGLVVVNALAIVCGADRMHAQFDLLLHFMTALVCGFRLLEPLVSVLAWLQAMCGIT